MQKTAVGLPHARLKAKLSTKAEMRPKASIIGRMPAGALTMTDERLPSRKDVHQFGELGDAAGDARYAEAIRNRSECFAHEHRSMNTAIEHERNALSFEDYLVEAGHGSYFVQLEDVPLGMGSVVLQSSKAGGSGDAAVKVVSAELIVAYLQAKYTNDETAPKGGLRRLGKGSPARAMTAQRKQLCGDSSKWKENGVQFADEPYSMQAYDKMVYGIRDTYKRCLRGTAMENPADDPLVSGFHSGLRRVLGYKPQHVPKVSLHTRIRTSAGSDRMTAY
jgi:hypothetical protein